MNIADEWILADNSDPPYKTIASGSKKGITVHDLKQYREIKESILNEIRNDKD